MKESYMFISLLLCLLSFNLSVHTESNRDSIHIEALKASLGNSSILKWFDPEPCKWNYITCRQNRVIRIQINYLSLGGSLPQDLQYLDVLEILEVASNRLSGPIPSLAGLSSLKHAQFDKNFFSYVPFDFFRGLTSLRSISFDFNPNISSWEIPESLKDVRGLKSFSANVACISGTIPDFFWADTFPRLRHLHLAMNNLHGKIPSSFAKSSIQTLWLHDQNSDFKLHGSVAVLRNKTSLTQVRLAGNSFTGPLPDLSKLISLEELNLRYNWLTGVVPLSLANLPKLSNLYLAHNLLQGPTPAFVNSKLDSDIGKDANGFNSFCLDDPGVACDSGVEVLLSIAESMGYPLVFAKSWKGNDPCDSSRIWKGISCDDKGNIKVVNLKNLGLSGPIPNELTGLPNLVKLDVSNNHLSGEVPSFRLNVNVNTDGNPDIENYRHVPHPESPEKPPSEVSCLPEKESIPGEMSDGTKIAVKRMKFGVVRHCHLVALLGYCLEGNERILVYEFMPQGSLSRHLFNWKEEGLEPLEWSRRLSIALDVDRGLEYLHSLANDGFIHRDLKPSNILLRDDMHAKVADFGLALLVPDKGKDSIETRLVGTPGYIAPEYIVTGRVTTKADVFSFGVILMELITGRKAIETSHPKDIVHLVPWFRRMHTNKSTFPNAIDETVALDEETLASVSTVAELADHCCTGKPCQRPDMNHIVNVLSCLIEPWRPVKPVYDDIYGIDIHRDRSQCPY
ncbi:hypothetical protein Pint_22478 [Pistacia integerrima]|uniref:Uncharacterized protein n=1 Tax=Pistacia integerrima TaxID=434235 RepID=A0ACC0YLW2_9ROSI|nr:hypothetical protein Pint_22478 [Pistacia integerrima]